MKPLKFTSPEPQPTELQREMLALLIEECAEVQQRATKMLRFGIAEVQPGQSQTNAERLSSEVGDLCAVIDILSEPVDGSFLLVKPIIVGAVNPKKQKIAIFIQSQAKQKA